MITADPTTACKVCAKSFFRFRSLQQVCSSACAAKVPKIARKAAVADRRETKAKLQAIKPRSKWMAEAQQAFNAWVRARDAALPCVSCNGRTGKQNAGHYLSTGARPELRFDPLNVHLQCERCNTYLHGNLIPYRVELIRRIGLEAVERLEGPHPPAKWSIDELKCIRDGYRIMAKQLREVV